MDREEQKREAVERMKILKLHKNPIEEFVKEGKLNLSENGGILFWLDEKQQKYVDDFEKKYNSVVYHVIHNCSEFDELLTLLYVSDAEEEWEYDRADLETGRCCAYVENLDDNNCSEFGGVLIRPRFGGDEKIVKLVRIA